MTALLALIALAAIASPADALTLRVHANAAGTPVTVTPIDNAAVLTASGTDQTLGAAVAITNNLIAVGAPGASVGGTTEGAVYVFTRPAGGWSGTVQSSAELVSKTNRPGEQLGTTVAISGTTIVAGAPNATIGDTDGQGAVDVFPQPGGGWHGTVHSIAELTAPDDGDGARFGSAVAVTGSNIAVGAPGTNWGRSAKAGVAYVYTRPAKGWTAIVPPPARLVAPLRKNGDALGSSIAFAGGDVAVAAPALSCSGGKNTASAYVEIFARPRAGWLGTPGQAARLTTGLGQLGVSMAARGTTLAVANPDPCGGSASAPGNGAVAVFVRPTGGWGKLHGPTALLKLGTSSAHEQVAISATTILATEKAAGGAQRGLALVAFTRPSSGWSSATPPAATIPASSSGPVSGTKAGLAVTGGSVMWGDGLLSASPAGWSGAKLTANLVPSAGAGYQAVHFTQAALDGDYAFALGTGGPTDPATNLTPMVVYVFHRAGAQWASQTPVAQLAAGAGDPALASLSVSGPLVLVGQPAGPAADGPSGTPFPGDAVLFAEPAAGWSSTSTPSATLTPAGDGTADACSGGFGAGVATDGTNAFVTTACTPGSVPMVDVFTPPADGWAGSLSTSAQLAAPGGLSTPIAVSGTTLVTASGQLPQSGGGLVANVFSEPASGWASLPEPSATLGLPGDATTSGASASLAISGLTVFVGAPAPGNTATPGAVYAYNQPGLGWTGALQPSAALVPTGAPAIASFGGGVATDGTSVLVGSGSAAPNSGDDYDVFSRPATGWSGQIAPSRQLAFSPQVPGDTTGGAVAGATVLAVTDGALFITTVS